MASWVIYKHTCTVSSKVYIGITCASMNARWKQHLVRAFTMQSSYHFHSAIRKYGKECWDHSILHSEITSLEEANALETAYIKQYDSFHNGYNSTLGGDGTKGRCGELSPLWGVPKSAYVIECLKKRKGINNHTENSINQRVQTRRGNLERYTSYTLYMVLK